MSVQEELRRRRRLEEPDFDAEQEVDVREAWGKVTRRWWLPAAGLALGIAVGFLLSLGGGSVYRAEALVYLGQPFAPGGTAPIPGLPTNPNTVSELVRAEATLRMAARQSGLPVSALRGNVSTQEILSTGRVRVPNQAPLYEIAVEGEAPGRVARAANVLGGRVVAELSDYAEVKIRGYRARLRTLEEALDSVNAQIRTLNDSITRATNLTPVEQLVLVSQLSDAEQRRATNIADQNINRQLLALGEKFERARIVTPAVARETTARSVRNSVVVGGLIGLILGALAALLAEPFLARRARRV